MRLTKTMLVNKHQFYFFNSNSFLKNHDQKLKFPGEKRRLAFLDMMLELARNESVLSEEEVREEVDTIMFEVWKGNLLYSSII